MLFRRLWAAAIQIAAALIFVVAAPARAGAPVAIASPDGHLVVTVTDDGGIVRYGAALDGKTVLEPGRLGLLFRVERGFDKAMKIDSVRTASADETWAQPWGERHFVRDHHNEAEITLSTTDDGPARKLPVRKMILRFRVFDDGIGFRYEVPAQRGLGKVEIVDELTEFKIPEKGTKAWWIPGRRWNRYEYLYRSSASLDPIEMAHTPMTARLADGTYLSIHEAALVDYGAMVLDHKRQGTFKADITPWSDGVKVKTKTPFRTPWRTIEIARDAKTLLNSDLILNLNEPNKLGDVSWVEPGKYVGVWWEMHINDGTWSSGPHHSATTENAKRYIDFAAKYGFKGVLVEGWNLGWDKDWFGNGKVFDFTKAYPDFDLPAVAAYARAKGVRLIGHHETAGGSSHYEDQMDAAFKLYESVGVSQVKTGYVADAQGVQRVDDKGVTHYEWHDGQYQVGHHLRVLEAAAKHKISIDSHEPVKDTGLRRTYPNWLSREGARGQEYNAWNDPPNPPEHESLLAFTRMLSGPFDFTPGIFDLEPNTRPPVSPDMPRHDPSIRPQTTLAKQLALYVVLYSPIVMAADLPENYEKHLDAFQFIRDVPTDWEESLALGGEPGDYVGFARKRRGGDDWFVGVVTDENARVMNVSLDFLDAGKTYVAEIYRDGPKTDWKTRPYDMVIEKRDMKLGDTLSLPLAPGGGAAVRFVPK